MRAVRAPGGGWGGGALPGEVGAVGTRLQSTRGWRCHLRYVTDHGKAGGADQQACEQHAREDCNGNEHKHAWHNRRARLRVRVGVKGDGWRVKGDG